MTAGPLLPRFVCLSTYPPRECGIATFSRDLIEAITTIYPHVSLRIAALHDPDLGELEYPSEVAWQIDQNSEGEFRHLAKELNAEPNTIVLIEHEYGIFGGSYGAHLLQFLRVFQGKVVTILHTTLPNPEQEMKAVTQELIDRSFLVQVFSSHSAEIITALYGVTAPKLLVLPHGIHPVLFEPSDATKEAFGFTGKTVLQTFGMLSRGKGLEYVIQALPEVVAQYPQVLYLITGATHPTVRRREGETYRSELKQLVQDLKLEDHVIFIDRYLPTAEILQYLKATDIYIATSLAPEQAVSGTFSYALGTGRSVISTAFSQAQATLTPEIGRLIPMRDVKAYTQAIRELLDHAEDLPTMHQAAYRETRGMLWTNVARSLFSALQQQLGQTWDLWPPLSLRHLDNMTPRAGLIQFAQHTVPDRNSGYTLDDNARALIFRVRLASVDTAQREVLLPSVVQAIRHLRKYQVSSGRYINYLGPDGRTPTFQNEQEDHQDGLGRVLWAWGEAWATNWLPVPQREMAQKAFLEMEKNALELTHLRAISFAILGLCAVLESRLTNSHRTRLMGTLFALTEKLIHHYESSSSPEWQWFEPNLRYSNGTLPLALLRASNLLPRTNAFRYAMESLHFLISVTFFKEVYVPIGQKEWFHQGSLRSTFDQQPEDPTATILACMEASAQTGDPIWKDRAEQTFSWFLGNNLLGKRMYDDSSGGCYDGLTPEGVNLNQGAESVVSYLIARLALEGKKKEHVKRNT